MTRPDDTTDTLSKHGGSLCYKRSLKTYFYASLDAATYTFAQSLLSQGVVTQVFQEAVSHATRVYQSVTLLRTPSSPSQTNWFGYQTSRTVNPQCHGILAVSASVAAREDNETEGQFDVDLEVVYIGIRIECVYVATILLLNMLETRSICFWMSNNN
jgi:hypothetical protein